MRTSAVLLQESDIRLWGLSSRQRLQRQLKEAGGVDILESVEDLRAADPVLLLNLNYLFEVRTLSALKERSNAVLHCSDDGRPAAAIVDSDHVAEAIRYMEGESEDLPADLERVTPQSFVAFDENLRRSKPPILKRGNEGNRRELEDLLYGNAYRGITDLVTKFVWPRPARQAVRLAANLKMTPNGVTTIGLLLTLAACWLFWKGHYGMGLLCGWLMTFLDTVDGKLARVTVQSSPFGHIYDHAIDLIHPPFWYIFWGMSLAPIDPVFGLDLNDYYGMIIAGYVAGRLVEGVFPLLGDCSIFTWRPFDAWFRLVTARRNPCLIILTLSVFAGRPDWGFVAVAVWTSLTTLVLIVRLLQGLVARLRGGRLQSWLGADDVANGPHAASYRIFGSTRSAYGSG